MLNPNIPTVTNTAHIYWESLYLVLPKKKPTRSTDKTLQDLKRAWIGYDTYYNALLLPNMETALKNPNLAYSIYGTVEVFLTFAYLLLTTLAIIAAITI